jgi:hypothetical protein
MSVSAKISFAICLIGSLVPSVATASGSVPIVPTSEFFPDAASCRSELVRQHEAQKAQVTDGRIPAPNGGVRQVFLETDGVRDLPGGRASYDSRIWFSHGSRDAASGKMRFTSTYESRQRICDSGVLLTKGLNGYSQPLFE